MTVTLSGIRNVVIPVLENAEFPMTEGGLCGKGGGRLGGRVRCILSLVTGLFGVARFARSLFLTGVVNNSWMDGLFSKGDGLSGIIVVGSGIKL